MEKDFEKLYPGDATFDRSSRIPKAKKVVAVIEDFKKQISKLSLLDYGSSVGLMTEYFGSKFKSVYGIDVDEKAIDIARKRSKRKNVNFKLSSSEKIPFKSNSFDIVVFNQIYEHVESPRKSVGEIYRILKPGGVCYFGARNKYFILDGHNPIPFLAMLPRRVSEAMVRIFLGKKEYDIKLYSLYELRNLVQEFEVFDYTLEVIKNPTKFYLNENLKFFYALSKLLYFLIPNYVWLLRKR